MLCKPDSVSFDRLLKFSIESRILASLFFKVLVVQLIGIRWLRWLLRILWLYSRYFMRRAALPHPRCDLLERRTVSWADVFKHIDGTFFNGCLFLEVGEQFRLSRLFGRPYPVEDMEQGFVEFAHGAALHLLSFH